MDDITIIARLCLDCQSNFVFLIHRIDTIDVVQAPAVLSGAAIENELGRFKLWASNIGAMNVGKASLDYRLKDVKYLTQNVQSLLEYLKESLSEGFVTPYNSPLI
jgi:hypothetical protein